MSLELLAHLYALGAVAGVGAILWLVSVALRNVSIVDIFWGPLFLTIALVHAVRAEALDVRAVIVLLLVAVWSLRLAVYLLLRNWGHGEDRRYQKIRQANDPGFWWKSLYIVFGLQAVLAWIVSLPLVPAIHAPGPAGLLAGLGIGVFALGLFFETVADLQLRSFKQNPENAGKVMDRGLWRYSRHPNYFGDCCVWWGFYLIALDAGGWWTAVGPALMTFLLLRVSGVALLERGMKRRPDYAAYIERTSSFFPSPPRS